MVVGREGKSDDLTGHAFAHGLENVIVLDIVGVIGLDLSCDARERALEGFLGRGVDHLGLISRLAR